EPLEDALRSVAKRSDINILIDRKLVSHLRAPALRGELSIEQAISWLLQGTNLRYEFVNENTVVLAAEWKKSKGGKEVHASSWPLSSTLDKGSENLIQGNDAAAQGQTHRSFWQRLAQGSENQSQGQGNDASQSVKPEES